MPKYRTLAKVKRKPRKKGLLLALLEQKYFCTSKASEYLCTNKASNFVQFCTSRASFL